MSEINDEACKEARQQIEKLRLENSELKEESSKLMEEMMAFTGLAGHTHKMGARVKQLESLLNRTADALEKGPSETHLQLIRELRKATQSTTGT